jgi:hypothetical protein
VKKNAYNETCGQKKKQCTNKEKQPVKRLFDPNKHKACYPHDGDDETI